jgi:hypothetical protein
LMGAARPPRPETPPAIEIPGRILAGAEVAGPAAPDGDDAPALEGGPPFASSPFASAAEFPAALEAATPAAFPAPAPDVVSTAVASGEGATTNRVVSSASGMTGESSGGTTTALITATAFGPFRADRVAGECTGRADSELTVAFGDAGGAVARAATCAGGWGGDCAGACGGGCTGGLAGSNDNFSKSMGNFGFGMRGSIARTINGFRGFGATGCSRFRVTGGGRTATGSVIRLGRRSGYASFGGESKSGLRIVCTPLVESGGLDTMVRAPA